MATSGTTSSAEASDISRVVVHTLDRDIAGAKGGIQCVYERRANKIANVTVFGGAASKDQRERLANAIDDIIADNVGPDRCYACAAGNSGCDKGGWDRGSVGVGTR